MNKIIDAFPFFNELNLLEIRLESLDPYVDFFLITEATTTFSGQQKQLYFEKNKDKFSKYESKIIHQVVDSIPAELNPFERDWFQRDAAKSIILGNFSASDVLIYGDVDEIPSIHLFENLHYLNQFEILHCAQDLYYYYLNLKEVSGKLLSYCGEYSRIIKKKWLGTVATTPKHLNNYTMTQLRDPLQKSFGKRIPKGGWHFSYCGTAEELSVSQRATLKIKSAAHQEYNNEVIFKGLEEKISNKKDIFNRKGSRFKVDNNFENLPPYIQDNLDKFSYLLANK